MKIQSLYIYPVKSLPAIRLNKSRITRQGLENDRSFILVNKDDKMLTQREWGGLTQFKLQTQEDGFEVTSLSSGQSVFISAALSIGKYHPVPVWKKMIPAASMPGEINSFFSDHLSFHSRLLSIDKSGIAHCPFFDAEPVLVINSGTMKFLSEMTEATFNPLRFRPNVIIQSAEPFAEEHWMNLITDTLRLRIEKMCSRCILINRNPLSGDMDRNLLHEIMPFAKRENKIKIGAYCRPQHNGFIHSGQDIYAQ